VLDGQEVENEEENLDPFAPIDDGSPQYDKAKTYWATWKDKDLTDALKEKSDAFYNSARMQGLIDRWVISYAFHHGTTPQDMRELATMVVGFTGNELERVRFHINLNRRYNRDAAIMALGEKASFRAKTLNDDQLSLAQAELKDKIINGIYGRYYEKHDPEVAEGEGFAGACGTHTRWDFQGGDEVQVDVPIKAPKVDPTTGQPVTGPDGKPVLDVQYDLEGNVITHPQPGMSGAPYVTTVYPWSVVREVRTGADDDLWVIVRETESKWNLIGQFGEEFRDAILRQSTQLDQYDFSTLFRLQMFDVDNKDMLVVQHFYHARSPAIPKGRYVVVCGDVVLWDGPCPVKEGVPYSEMRSASFVETTFPYADAWDIVSIVQALNQMNSDELQNLALFSRQSTYSYKGSNVTRNGITKGTHYEIPPGLEKPGSIQFASMAPTGDFKSYLLSMLDRVMGSSSTTRGEPDANVRSGEMAALLDSISIRYQSFRQQAARRYRIRNAQIALDMIARYGETKFFIDVAGAEDRTYVMAFTRDSLQGIQRVDMDLQSPMMQTASGRLQWAQTLMDPKIPPQERAALYEFVVDGDIDALLARDKGQRALIRKENERMITSDELVEPNATDDPAAHIPEHQAAVERLQASESPDTAAIERIRLHILKHEYTYLMLGQPLLLTHLGIAPPPPIGPTPEEPMGNAAFRFQLQLQSGMAMPMPMTPIAPNGVPAGQPNQPMQGAGSQAGGPPATAKTQQPKPPAQDPSAPGTSQTPTAPHPLTGTQMPQPSTPPGAA
jgi:hypothetical protein